MKRINDHEVELTDAERIAKEWHESLLSVGHGHGGATEQMLLRTPVDGMTWEVLKDMEFRKFLYGIRFIGPVARDDHRPSDEPVPRVEFLDDDGNRKSEAEVRRLGPDLYVAKDPDCDIEHLMTTQEIKDDDYVRFMPERHECRTELPTDLEFLGTIGAPGHGQSWQCRECKAPWVKVGDDFLRADEHDDDMEPPWMLRPEDVR